MALSDHYTPIQPINKVVYICDKKISLESEMYGIAPNIIGVIIKVIVSDKMKNKESNISAISFHSFVMISCWSRGRGEDMKCSL